MHAGLSAPVFSVPLLGGGATPTPLDGGTGYGTVLFGGGTMPTPMGGGTGAGVGEAV